MTTTEISLGTLVIFLIFVMGVLFGRIDSLEAIQQKQLELSTTHGEAWKAQVEFNEKVVNKLNNL